MDGPSSLSILAFYAAGPVLPALIGRSRTGRGFQEAMTPGSRCRDGLPGGA